MRQSLFAISFGAAALWGSLAFAACPTGGATLEAYIYGCPQASAPYVSSLRIPAISASTVFPNSATEYIPADTLADLTSAQTLSGKTLTNPTINGGVLGSGAWTVSAGTPTRYLGFDSGNNPVTGTPGGGGGGSGTVTSITAAAPLTGGTITTAGTIGIGLTNGNWFVGNGSNIPAATTPSAALDSAFGSTQGGVLYRSASAWSYLAPGVSGQFFETLGNGANPQWATPGGGGNVSGPGSSVNTNFACWNGTSGTLLSDCGYNTSHFLVTTSNLSDLSNVATGRNNLLAATSGGTPTRYLGLDGSNNVVTGTPAGGGSVSITAADTSVVVSPSPLTGTGTIAVGGPSHLTTFAAGTVPMGAGSSPFAASEITDVALGGVTVGAPTGGQKGAGTINMTGCFINNVPCAAGSSVAWSAITGGTNTSAAMVVGTGASLATSGSGTITATALPVSGLTGAGANVLTFLATPSSANFAAALTDETGTGAAVFGTTPTLTTPVINGGTFQTSQPWTVTGGTPTVYLGLDASSHLVSGTPAGGGGSLTVGTTRHIASGTNYGGIAV